MPLEHSSKSFAPASLTFTLKVKYRSSQRMFLLRSSSFSSQHCYLSLLPLFKWPSSTISSSLVSRTSSSIISSYQYARLCIPPSFLSSCLFPRSPPSIVSYFLLSTPSLSASHQPLHYLPPLFSVFLALSHMSLLVSAIRMSWLKANGIYRATGIYFWWWLLAHCCCCYGGSTVFLAPPSSWCFH